MNEMTRKLLTVAQRGDWAPHDSYPLHVQLAQYILRAEFMLRMGEFDYARAALEGAARLAHPIIYEYATQHPAAYTTDGQ